MAIEGRTKAIAAGRIEVYDVVADPGETQDLAAATELSRALRNALKDYPPPSAIGQPTHGLSAEDRGRLASLGYVSAGAAPLVRRDAPRPADQTQLFDTLERASALFVAERWLELIPLLERIRAADPGNLDAALRLATAHSALGHSQRADALFDEAARLAPESRDVRLYRALHFARGQAWQRALPLLEKIVAETPERLPALEALAGLRERQGDVADAIALRQKVYALRDPSALELVRLGELAMSRQQTPLATTSFERARALQGGGFAHDLELGVLYLAARRYPEARDALDRVPARHRDYAMALFKRAQVSVLLKEPDRKARIQLARDRADATTRELIRRERLFLEQ
jgi:tetratricopeptide (TPR) repeat protein